jgi:hypothetical protein
MLTCLLRDLPLGFSSSSTSSDLLGRDTFVIYDHLEVKTLAAQLYQLNLHF